MLYIYTLNWIVRRDEQLRSPHLTALFSWSPSLVSLSRLVSLNQPSSPPGKVLITSEPPHPTTVLLLLLIFWIGSPGCQQRTYLNNIPLTVINILKYLIETLKNLFVWQQEDQSNWKRKWKISILNDVSHYQQNAFYISREIYLDNIDNINEGPRHFVFVRIYPITRFFWKYLLSIET